jgi:hypothetical protein
MNYSPRRARVLVVRLRGLPAAVLATLGVGRGVCFFFFFFFFFFLFFFI